MQSQSMQKTFHGVHTHQNPKSDQGEDNKSDRNKNRVSTDNSPFQSFVKKYFRKLRMGKRKGPKSEIGSCVRNTTENEFDCFNDLVYEFF